MTVENFLAYVRAGHFDNTLFHRVIDGFMIQGGGFAPDFTQKPTRAPVENEAANGLKNKCYTVAMARTSDPHSATAQFFINVADNAFLDFRSPDAKGWGYCVFGRITDGMLPTSNFAYLDEIFKSSPPMLNPLLDIYAKRQLKIGGRTLNCSQLITIFMSLNLVDDPEPWSTRLLNACKDDMTS